MSHKIDVVVIGAGVIGLSCALSLTRRGRRVIILEADSGYGRGISSRNSGVIHAGVYYPPGTLKSKLCVAGRELLYAYCRDRGVPHMRLGKLIVAYTPDEVETLDVITKNGAAAGVTDLQIMSAKEVTALEPELHCEAAILSPSTGILDTSQLMQAMLGEFESEGGLLVCRSRVTGLKWARSQWQVSIGDHVNAELTAEIVINAAGLSAQQIAGRIQALDAAHVPPLLLARGSYFAYSGTVPFTHLIYPVPVSGGLGIHLTLDLNGSAKFGPDVEWIDAVSYSADPGRRQQFADAGSRIWPSMDPNKLSPAYSGIRPKLSRGEFSDFVISGPDKHGLPGLVNLFGIESPGLTASLAIGEEVADVATHTS